MTEGNVESRQVTYEQQNLLNAFQGQDRDLLHGYLTDSADIELTPHARGAIYKELVTNEEHGGYDRSDPEKLAASIDPEKIRNMRLAFKLQTNEKGKKYPVIIFRGQVKVGENWEERDYQGIAFSPSRFLQKKRN